MTQEFSHILLSLRKERKLTQKQAAKELDISPALLSHYEKGIRECGLGFVVRAADYYHVSCDFLLGRTTDRSGMAPELVSPSHGRLELTAHEDGRQKQILQAVHILFEMLERCDHERLTEETVRTLSAVIYALFREICKGKSREDPLFTLSTDDTAALFPIVLSRSLSRVGRLTNGKSVKEEKGLSASKLPSLSEEQLRRDYPFFVSSLTRLFAEAETAMQDAE